MKYPNPIIFIHGIQGAWLKNQYPVDYQDEIYWTGILKKKFDKLHLSAINSDVDKDINTFIFPHQAVPLIYESIVEELRSEATEQSYLFTYDWRKDNRLAAEKLGEFIRQILERAKIHAKSGQAPPDKITLVGHSMGGLVIKWFLLQVLPADERSLVDKIITIATPYRGSLKAIEAILPGARRFFGMEAQKNMRKASRTLPGVYQLLPSWDKAVIDKSTGDNIDIFDAKNWQGNVVRKLERNYGADFLPAMLEDAGEFSAVVKTEYPDDLKDRFYCVYGEGSETLKQVRVDRNKDNYYDFAKADENKKGDGTVHNRSSYVEAAGHLKADRLPIEIGGQHAQLPNHEDVQDYIINLLTGSELLQTFRSKE